MSNSMMRQPGAIGMANNTSNATTSARPIRPGTIPRPDLQQQQQQNPKGCEASLCQIIAFAMSYRRLAVVWGTVPFLCVTLPMLCKIVLLSLNSLTQDHGLVTVALATFLVFAWYQMIRWTAPTPAKEQEAYQKSHMRAPFIMCVISYGFIQTMLKIANHSRDAQDTRPDSLQWTPTFAWGLGVRPAMGFLLMGTGVMIKFVGYNSVVRCSTMPLVSNHFYNAITSWEGFVDSLVSPSDNAANGDMTLGSFGYRLHHMGRRYQYPSFLSSSILVLFTACLGASVGHYILVPYWLTMVQPDATRGDVHAAARARFLIGITCSLTMLFHLCLSTLNGHSHELNPKRYYQHNKSPTPTVKPFLERLSSIGISSVLVPATSFFVVCIYHGDYKQYETVTLIAMIFKEQGALLLFSVLSALGVAFYSAGIDEAARSVLCTPGSRLQHFVRQVTCGRAPNSPGAGRESSITFEQEDGYVVDVMLHSLMHSNESLVSQISKSTASVNPSYLKLEQYERERNEHAIVAAAKMLLANRKEFGEAPVEEDILRHSILESIGGSSSSDRPSAVGNSNAVATIREDYPASGRHQEAIQYWIQAPSNTINLQRRNTAATSIEPKGVTLVRALCAYSGGLGQALIDCSKPQSPYISWRLPPGAVVAAEYAMVALARCIEQDLKYSQENAADWRSTHLSMFIPAAFNSAYRLHRGVREFAKYRIAVKNAWNLGPDVKQPKRTEDNTAVTTEQIAQETPELFEILRACDGSVKIITGNLRSSQGSSHGINAVENALDDGCVAWVQQINSQA